MICDKEVKAGKKLSMIRNSGILLKQNIKQQPYLFILLFMIPALINFGGCCAYSFTGSSVPEHLNSIAIPVSDDRSGSGESGLREEFTNLLTQKFVDDNSLAVTERVNANAVLETIITSLSDAPAIVSAGEQIETRRITITVEAVYRDLVKRVTIYEKSFSNYGDYPADASISQRQEAIRLALDRITDDILLETVSGW